VSQPRVRSVDANGATGRDVRGVPPVGWSQRGNAGRNGPGCLAVFILPPIHHFYIVSESSSTPTVLVVDDEKEVADVYALRLRNEYDTKTAYGGEDAIDKIGEEIDVVLLDRRMPDVSGDDVLAEIRDRDLDCRVIMITAVDPDFDIIDMPFDDYLCKPVEKTDLVAAIDQQLTASTYDDRLTEYLEVTSKIALLEAEKTTHELEENDEIASLKNRADELKAEMDDVLSEFDDIEAAFQEIGRHPS
jgi:DNA-binding response OmpR family regulator